MRISAVVTADEMADLAVQDAVYHTDGTTLVYLGGLFNSVCAWVTAADADRISAAWADAAARLQDLEHIRAMPTLEEVTADRDAAIAAEGAS